MNSTSTLASLLSLVLLCQSCGGSRRKPPTVGYILDVAKVPTPDPRAPVHQLCGDARYIVVSAEGNGRVKLNGEADVSLDQLTPRLEEILQYRAEKVVYVTGGPDVSWTDFVGAVDRVWPEADLVSLITPQVERLARQPRCLKPACGQCENLRPLHAR